MAWLAGGTDFNVIHLMINMVDGEVLLGLEHFIMTSEKDDDTPDEYDIDESNDHFVDETNDMFLHMANMVNANHKTLIFANSRK